MIEVVLWSVLIGLVSYRTWRFIGRDSISEPLRAKMGSGWFYEWATCPWCSGTWYAVGVTVAVDFVVGVPYPFLVAPAAAAITGILGDRD